MTNTPNAVPDISVIISVYNTAPFLKQCLNSIVNQTLTNIEIICVDDSSEDGSYDILQEFAAADKRVIVVRQEHAGAGKARNTGLAMAKGKYLSILDSDDYWVLDKLEKQFKQVYEDKLNDLIPEFIYKDKKQELENKIKYEKEKLQDVESKFNTLNKLEDKEDLIFKAINDIKANGLTKEELSRLFDKIVVFDKEEITEDIKQEYNLNDEMYKELYENGGLVFHLKFMYPQTITNRRM